MPLEQPRYPYGKVAVALRDEIDAGAINVDELLPAIKDIAARHEVSASTARRAVSLLQKWR